MKDIKIIAGKSVTIVGYFPETKILKIISGKSRANPISKITILKR